MDMEKKKNGKEKHMPFITFQLLLWSCDDVKVVNVIVNEKFLAVR